MVSEDFPASLKEKFKLSDSLNFKNSFFKENDSNV